MLTLHRSLRGRQMEKIKKFWNAVSYEVVIAAGLIVWFLTGRALDLQGWSSAWNAMDYSMGTGSRLLIGSIYRLFYGEYLELHGGIQIRRRGNDAHDTGACHCAGENDPSCRR